MPAHGPHSLQHFLREHSACVVTSAARASRLHRSARRCMSGQATPGFSRLRTDSMVLSTPCELSKCLEPAIRLRAPGCIATWRSATDCIAGRAIHLVDGTLLFAELAVGRQGDGDVAAVPVEGQRSIGQTTRCPEGDAQNARVLAAVTKPAGSTGCCTAAMLKWQPTD